MHINKQFDPQLTLILGEAFDDAMQTVEELGRGDLHSDDIAQRILHAAESGERDPQRIYERALTSIEMAPDRLH